MAFDNYHDACGAVVSRAEAKTEFEKRGMPTIDGIAQALQELLSRDDLPESVRAEAMSLLQGGQPNPSVPLTPEIEARLMGMHERAVKRISSVDPRVKQHATRLLQTALQAGTAAKRVMWLQRAADVMGQGYAGISACKAGCSHCCLIPVKISQAEAQVLGKALGRAPTPQGIHNTAPAPGDWWPCTFLKDNQCSIYAHRPAVCRSHLNVDQDDLLCRPLPDASVPVPYLDVTPFVVASVAAAGNSPWADIRQWFPAVKTENSPEN